MPKMTYHQPALMPRKLTFVSKVPDSKDGKADVMRDESRGVEWHERIKPFEKAYDNRKTERDV